MKLIFSFLLFILISATATLSKSSLDNEFNSFSIVGDNWEDYKKEINSYIDLINCNLTTIKTELLKKKKFKEAGKVESIRNVLISSVKEKCIKSIDYLIKYEKYFVPKESNDTFPNLKYSKLSIGVNNDAARFLFFIRRFAFYLKRIRIGLTKDRLIDEAHFVVHLRMALRTKANLIIEQSFDFIDKYLPEHKPLKPDDPEERKKEEEDIIKDVFNETVKSLIQVEDGLRKYGKEIEANEVKSTFCLVNKPEFLKFHLEACDFMYKNAKYWMPMKSFDLNSNLENPNTLIFWFLFKYQTLKIRECEKGLLKDKKEAEAKKAQSLKKGLENRILSVYEDAFFYFDFYEKYVPEIQVLNAQ